MKTLTTILLLFLTLQMSPGALQALSTMTGLEVYTGNFIYLDGVKDVAIRARGRDFLGYSYQIKCRWRGGYPAAIVVYGAEVEI